MRTGIAATPRSRTCGARSRTASSWPKWPTSSPGSAIDLACGEGQNAIWLATRGWTVRGVDYSGVAIEKARARAQRDGVDVDFVEADLVEYEPEAGAFDLVLVLYLHVPADERGAIHATRCACRRTRWDVPAHRPPPGQPDRGRRRPERPRAPVYARRHRRRARRPRRSRRPKPVLRDVARHADRPAIDVLVRASAPLPSSPRPRRTGRLRASAGRARTHPPSPLRRACPRAGRCPRAARR